MEYKIIEIQKISVGGMKTHYVMAFNDERQLYPPETRVDECLQKVDNNMNNK